MVDGIAADLIGSIVSNAAGVDTEANVKQQEKQLIKYNNIYDRLRKKRDLVECLMIQRRFMAFVRKIKDEIKVSRQYIRTSHPAETAVLERVIEFKFGDLP